MEEKKQNIIEQDYDKESIVMKNDYLLKSELTSRIVLLIFFGWLISINLTPEPDSLDELYRRLALGTAIFGVLWTVLTNLKQLKTFIKNDLYIKIYKDKIIYDYVSEDGRLKTDIINKKDVSSKKWSFYPLSVKDSTNDIWITEIKDKDDKRWAYLFSPFYIAVSLVYLLIFICLNRCRLKKYFTYRYEGGVIAIPYDKVIKKTGVDFEWKSLINRYILKGGSYAK